MTQAVPRRDTRLSLYGRNACDEVCHVCHVCHGKKGVYVHEMKSEVRVELETDKQCQSLARARGRHLYFA